MEYLGCPTLTVCHTGEDGTGSREVVGYLGCPTLTVCVIQGRMGQDSGKYRDTWC